MQRVHSVAEDPWIDTRVRDDLSPSEREELQGLLPGALPGGRVAVGLRTLFHCAHLLADLDVAHPPVESVVRRLLAAFTARVGGLDSGRTDDWLDVREELLVAGRFDAAVVDAYVERYAGRWNVYGSVHPFLQDPRLATECSQDAPPARLAMDRPSGNNPVWSSTVGQYAPVADAAAVQWLLAWRGFGPAGMAAVRSHGTSSSKSCKAGPYRALISYFPHAAERLFTTLVLSVPAPAAWPTNPGADRAPWECDALPDPRSPAAPCGPVSLLTARTTHAVLLTAGEREETVGCRITWGAAADLPAAVDPYVIERDAGGPLRAAWDRSVWRDLDALLLKQRPGSKTTLRRPTVFDTVAELPAEITARLGVRVLAWDQDRQDRNNHWYAATTPPLLAHVEERDPNGAAAIAALRAQAEATGAELGRALSSAWHAVNTGRRSQEREGFVGAALVQFWQEAEEEFWDVVADTTRTPAFRPLALACFDTAARRLKHTVHGQEAAAKARVRLAHPPVPTSRATAAA
ncbi:type I-E CRISPR-associated protein Cse1/CasA [Streptomyces melanogenes]|uniref:type I-E CRISPR-associated protein Cse1/CasA n=1 Tax=Streptomyces melanogenes TaxID=67326 RepID=UPI00167C9128|nr:type I-E CRISPR-associated protein Cse1/CasA [Streptomyces melanogenes]GGP80150.1 hypothetical protein GCM10010278_68260 [Streptomyces melanogenes]